MRGKLIVIEGIDSSGKNTQSNLLMKNIRNQGIQIQKYCFPNYETPTGKIVGGPYLGKEKITSCWFPEGPIHVASKVASLYYAADRKYNIHKITWLLENGIHVILDRYVYSNMAHQGCKIENKEERYNLYDWLEQLEFSLLELPKPDIAILLDMPISIAQQLIKERDDLDDIEKDFIHLKQAKSAYYELAEQYDFYTIACSNNEMIRPVEEIETEIYELIMRELHC